MSRQEKENTSQKIKRLAAASFAGLAVYLVFTASLSFMVLSEKLPEDIICSHGNKLALLLSSLLAAILIKLKGKGRSAFELPAASITLWAMCAAISLTVNGSIDFSSAIISLLVCLVPVPLMSISKSKNSKLHKRKTRRS